MSVDEREVRRDKGGKWLPGHSPKSPGRPRAIQPDDDVVEMLERLAKIQCTKAEARAVLGVSEAVFNALLRDNERANDAWEGGREKGKASLRRTQWKHAETNATMQIWLGKQYLDQRDKSDQALTGPDGGPIEMITNFLDEVDSASPSMADTVRSNQKPED